VTGARFLEVDPEAYHQLDGLSASIATTLITRSPLHAWTQHPKFGAKGKTPTKSMDRGTVVHALVLGKGKEFAALPFDDFRTNAAKAARDAARDKGLVPIKTEDLDDARVIAERVTSQLADHGIHLTGESEVAIEWYEPSSHGPVLCRCMMDHLLLEAGTIVDLKISASAAPPSIERSAETFGYAIQRAAYTRALEAVRPELAGRVDFLFAFGEPEEPYALNLCRGDGAFREVGERRWLRAVEQWASCLNTNTWPAYGSGINPLSVPAWVLKNEEYAA